MLANRVRTSITVDPELKSQADRYGISLSRACDEGIRRFLGPLIEGKSYVEKEKEAKTEIEHKSNLTTAVTFMEEFKEILNIYDEAGTRCEDPFQEDAEFLMALDTIAKEYGVDMDDLATLTKTVILSEVPLDTMKNEITTMGLNDFMKKFVEIVK